MTEVVAGLESCRSGAAATPTLHAAVEEDLKLEEFLSEMASSHASRHLQPQARQPASATRAVRRHRKADSPARTAKTVPLPVAEPDVTQSWSGSDVGTDAHVKQTLSGVQPPLPAVSAPPEPPSRPRRPRRRDWRTLAAAAAGGLLLVLLGVWVIVRDKQGREVARVAVPEGGRATVETATENGAAERGASSPRPGTPGRGGGGEATWNLPPGAPPPAIAPFGAKQAKEHQEAWAKHLGVPVEFENSIGMKFMLIPPGEFDMGSPEAEAAKLSEEINARKLPWTHPPGNEVPQHRVRITQPFWLSRYEVTRGQFRRFVDDGGYRTEAERSGKGIYLMVDGVWKQDPRYSWKTELGSKRTDDQPVDNVSWNDATAFARWLSEKEGGTTHLPTEAQWEYACRAGTTTRWYSGDDEKMLKPYAWCGPHVGHKTLPNAWGLYDMHGKMHEWCRDRWSKGYYATSPRDDPPGASEGHQRVLRGGMTRDAAVNSRSSSRTCDGALRYSGWRGFRVARTVSLPAGGAASPQKSGTGHPLTPSPPTDRPAPKAAAPATPPPTAKPAPSWNLPAGSPPPAIAPFDAKKAKEHQEAWAKHLRVPVEMTNSIGMRFMLIPPGEFDMGSTEAEVARWLEEVKSTYPWPWCIDPIKSEAPPHRVRITKPFWLGVHEVTRGQFRRFVDERGYKTDAERDGQGGHGLLDGQWKRDPRCVWNRELGCEHADDYPVATVTWSDVTAFCTWLSEKEGETSHLPSEAQWEYACRAGTTTAWHPGDDQSAWQECAWFLSNASQTMHRVGQKSANPWGLYDMHGNVGEWCQDWFGQSYYATSPIDDPPGASEGLLRVCRGGSWNLAASLGRASFRCGNPSRLCTDERGFRLARAFSSPGSQAANPTNEVP